MQESKSDQISEADKQALLESLANARAHSANRDYDPSITYWPPLVAAFIGVVCLCSLFNWYVNGAISRAHSADSAAVAGTE